MSGRHPSLVRRLTLGFVMGPLLGIALLVLVIRPLAVELDGVNAGPEVATSLLAGALRRSADGGLELPDDSEVLRLARRSPDFWFVILDGKRVFARGIVPAAARRLLATLPPGLDTAEFHGVGAAGRTGDASLYTRDSAAGTLRLFAGGVAPDAIDSRAWLAFLWHDEEFGMAMFFLILFCVSGAPFAIPLVLASIRPTARAAGRLDAADLSGRLPEKGVVKELLPLVRAFNAALDRLGEAFDRRRRFIADVAHELRTPLAVLNMQVEGLPPGAGKPDLQRTVFRLGQMVGQMLDAERLTLAGRRREPVDLVALARAAVADIAPLAFSNGYDVAFSAARPIISVDGDPQAISRALANLLGNAVAHGGGRGTIEVRVSESRWLEVVDEGPGVPVEAGERIFEPFYRGRWDRDGCGLGLHLVREVMEAHGGRARLIGDGPGARFRLEFASAS